MLQGKESISKYKASNVLIWMTMAFQGGFLNTGGFMTCHRFVSHVTGYGTLIPYELEKSDGLEALAMTIVPVCFLLGAMVSGYLVDSRLKLHRRPKYTLAFGLITLLVAVVLFLGISGTFGTFGVPMRLSRASILLAALSFVCGVQNGTITTVSHSVIRTTHLTGIITDLGIGLTRLLYRKKMTHTSDDETRAVWMRIGIIVFFTTGSLVGYKIFTAIGYHGFIVPLCTSGILSLTMLYFARARPEIAKEKI